AKMEELSHRFPSGLHYSIPYNTTIFVKNSIAEVYKTLWQAGVLVLIVILVFLQNFRATLVPATTVPVTIIGAFAGMAALGYTVNLSTLFALISAVNAATLKPTQCALWLRTPVPPQKRNFLYRAFNHVYDRIEQAYTGLIGRMVRVSGLTVLAGLALACAGIWGIARLPTAF